MNRDAWDYLKQYTKARIALGRAGGSIPTAELLNFRLAHARARDAVNSPFQIEAFAQGLQDLGIPYQIAKSRAQNRQEYLLRPDLGRRLDASSCTALKQFKDDFDLTIIISDGLSAEAVHRNALPFMAAFVSLALQCHLRLSPTVIVRNARVAIQDEIGELFGSRVALIALGERPGLGSADSLGLYFVYAPRSGRTDADRNCISNVREGGLAPEAAAHKVIHLIQSAITLGLSGVQLKDETNSLLTDQRSSLKP